MNKSQIITDTITRRIISGEYQLTPFPTVRELAVEAGVSLVTAQKIVRMLQEQGLIQLGARGRFEVTRCIADQSLPLRVAYLDNVGPEFRNVSVGWVDYLRAAAKGTNTTVRHVIYDHWDDPVITETLNSFDGVFLVPLPTHDIPGDVVQKIFQKQRVVLVDGDYTHLALPSILFYPPVFVQRLLDHLAELGHTRIDCLNVQPLSINVEARMTQWQLWMAVHQFQGRLVNEPVEIGGSAIQHAYRVMHRILDEHALSGTALFCNTGGAALGAMRAFHERGIRVGTDIALCATYSEEAPYLSPSLTTLRRTDAVPFFSACIDWMRRDEPWVGPLLMQPQETEIVVGESTVPTTISSAFQRVPTC